MVVVNYLGKKTSLIHGRPSKAGSTVLIYKSGGSSIFFGNFLFQYFHGIKVGVSLAIIALIELILLMGCKFRRILARGLAHWGGSLSRIRGHVPGAGNPRIGGNFPQFLARFINEVICVFDRVLEVPEF